MTTPDYATRIVLERLRVLEHIQASGAQISGRPARGLVLPPPDEDSDIAGRIAMYRAWLARHAGPAELRQQWRERDAHLS